MNTTTRQSFKKCCRSANSGEKNRQHYDALYHFAISGRQEVLNLKKRKKKKLYSPLSKLYKNGLKS